MNRRQFLAVSALSIPLSGCLDTEGGDTAGTNSPTEAATEPVRATTSETKTETPPTDGATPACWPSMCEGTKLVEVSVAHGFSGELVFQPGCRDEAVSIQSGKSVQIDRKADAETCEVRLSINGERAFTEKIEEYESLTLRIDANGNVESTWVAL